MKRPERSCKTTTKALMKLTFTEDYDFADDSDASVSSDGDDRKSVDTSSVQTSHLDEDKTETSSLQSEDVESNASRFVKSFGLKLEMNNWIGALVKQIWSISINFLPLYLHKSLPLGPFLFISMIKYNQNMYRISCTHLALSHLLKSFLTILIYFVFSKPIC